MITSKFIKETAKKLGATVCGIGAVYSEPNLQKDPRAILPNAKCIIGFGFAVPKGIYKAMERGVQQFTYTTAGVKYIDEEMAEILLLKMGAVIEDAGYDACLQKTIPGIRACGDKSTNPEVRDTYELISESVCEGKPVPDVIIDFGSAAEACGIGKTGKSGKIINRKYGPFMRYCFIITDAPLECDAPYTDELCTGCNACARACPAEAISENGLDTWQCSVYYKGAHKSNPFMTDGFLKGHPERELIINGKKRFDALSAREIYPELNFLPSYNGYAACLCGRKCDIACYEYIKKERLV